MFPLNLLSMMARFLLARLSDKHYSDFLVLPFLNFYLKNQKTSKMVIHTEAQQRYQSTEREGFFFTQKGFNINS